MMNRAEIIEKFRKIVSNSEYVRVTETHPLELYLGKNENGYLTLRLNGDFTPIKILGSSILEIKQVRTSHYNSIMFCYTSKENISLFYNFCEDIINQTINTSEKDGYIEIINRFNKWKKMFYGGVNILSENEILGLIGELLFLKDTAFQIFGITVGLNGWSGPDSTHKDFSFKDEWYEIKSINSFKNSIKISSIEQLDSEYDGKLIVYIFEKMSQSFNGITLNKLVLKISKMIKYDEERELFFEKLKTAGYSYNDLYDNYVYNLTSTSIYRVDNSFPRIKSNNLPKCISKVQYEINLSLIEKFKEL